MSRAKGEGTAIALHLYALFEPKSGARVRSQGSQSAPRVRSNQGSQNAPRMRRSNQGSQNASHVRRSDPRQPVPPREEKRSRQPECPTREEAIKAARVPRAFDPRTMYFPTGVRRNLRQAKIPSGRVVIGVRELGIDDAVLSVR